MNLLFSFLHSNVAKVMTNKYVLTNFVQCFAVLCRIDEYLENKTPF